MKSNLEALLEEFSKNKHDRKTIKQLKRYFCAQCVVLEQQFKYATLNLFQEIQVIRKL